MPVAVSESKSEIDATLWLVRKVAHTIGEGGFTSAFELEA